MAASGAGGALLALALDDDEPTTTPATSLSAEPTGTDQGNPAPDEPLSQAAATVLPSVVSIGIEAGLGAGQGSGQGSGVVISSDGQILTNNHVVAGATEGGAELTVTFNDGSEASAEVLGRDPATDLAVIQAEGVDGLTPASLGSSGDLNVGDAVMAIGSPLGLEGSVTSGIVSALDRAISLPGAPESPFSDDDAPPTSTVIDAIQTDAAINPGNSGGALTNAEGEVVGINTAIASLASGIGTDQGGNIGVGFAIPIDSARDIAERLVEDGEITHAFLGVTIGDVEEGNGALIGDVDEGTPAEDAGLEPDDVITRVDDREIASATDLTAAIRSHQPGDTVTITYERDGDEQTTEATLTELPTD
jgi:putative serine protease PepD